MNTRSKVVSLQGAQIYQLKVTLQGINPPIWRRILVPSHITLYQLHRILQVVMGWKDCHLHIFDIEGKKYAEPDEEWEDLDMEILNEKKTRLSQVVSKLQSCFIYQYDFGDGWNHELILEKTSLIDPKVIYAICVGGKRACPPEDCGGIGGYEDFLQAIASRAHPEHERCLEWAGGYFDPEGFDANAVNWALQGLRIKIVEHKTVKRDASF